jgi:DNA processing protein
MTSTGTPAPPSHDTPVRLSVVRSIDLIRNRLVAAATLGMVLTEAAAQSGATQMMNRALVLRRVAMVVPGPVTSAMSVGCHQQLRTRPDAILVTGLPHVLEAVGRIGEHDAQTLGIPSRRTTSLI